MGIALTPEELAERLIADRQHYHRRTNTEKSNGRLRFTVDDLNIIRWVGENTLDGWDMEDDDDRAT